MSHEGDVMTMNHSELSTKALRELNDKCLINVYGTRKLAIVRGEGSTLWDAEGNAYLDFFAGIAVTNLGHCHPAVTAAISEQAAKLVHVSNLYYIEPQIELASLLKENSFADRWFFGNSGAEAIEGAIKLVRRYWSKQGTPKPGIVTALHSFHGRTTGAMTATGQPKYQEGFEPLMPGFSYVPYNDIEALEKALTPDVGAVILEPIQGEGGVRIPAPDYFSEVRRLCNSKNVLLVLDEVQTGLGRTGPLFAYQDLGIVPDVMTLAKGLANGVPIGALGCSEEVAKGFDIGMHASTFGGNPLSTAAGVATMKTLLAPGFLEGAKEVGRYFASQLERLQSKHQAIIEIRAKGLMIGIEMTKPIAPLMSAMLDRGVICGPAGPNILRFLPALIISRSEVDEAVEKLDDALGSF